MAFIGSILLIQYKKWQLQLPITIIVVIHHGVFAYTQFIGYSEIYFTDGDYMDLQTFVVHVLLAAIIFFLCGYWGYVFKKNANEIEIINATLETQLNSISNNLIIADQITKGNYDAHFDTNQDSDKLSLLLQEMGNNFKINAQKDFERNWTSKGTVEIGQILLKNQHDETVLYREIIKFIVKYLNVNQGGLFTLNELNPDNAYIEMVACYAFDTEKKKNFTRFSLNDTLIGEAISDAETIIVDQLPSDYTLIESGLGQSKSGFLIIVPLKINNKSYGALELVSFSPIQKYKITFVETIASSIASTMSFANKNSQTQSLLKEMQIQEEHLRNQEEDLRQSMEEIHASNEEMQRKENEIHKLLEITKLNEANTKEIELKAADKLEKLFSKIEHLELELSQKDNQIKELISKKGS